MSEEISFIHAADLHLDSPFRGLSHLPESIFDVVRQSTFQSFDRLIHNAITKQVDFILLVGDLFDYERQSLKAQVHLRNAFEKLKEYNIQVYLSYGNHDFIHGNLHAVTYPDNVFIFPNEQISSFIYKKKGIPLAKITGFSYENRAVKEAKITEYPNKDNTIPFHIGTLHGSLYGNKEHDTYAPFQLQQLQDKNYDYWALGHIHQRVELKDGPPIIYSGNIQGRHRKETGEKGCYYVKMAGLETTKTFVPLQSIQFMDLSVNISYCETIEAVEKTVIEHLPKKSNGHFLVHLTLESISEKWFSMHQDGILQEIIDVINDRIVEESPWIYIYKTKIRMEEVQIPEHNEFFIGEIKKAFTELMGQSEINELYHHPKGRRFLKRPSDELMSEAEQLLLIDLLKMEKADKQ